MKRMLFLAPVSAIVGLASAAGPATAAAPEHIGPLVDSDDFTVDCGRFEATVTGTSSTRLTAFLDAAGEVTRVAQSVRAPNDVWTNTATGKTIIVRGEFQQTYTPVPAPTKSRQRSAASDTS